MKFLKRYFAFIWLITSPYGLFSQSCLNISTYFGESAIDEFKGICKDPLGNIYLLGNTTNSNLPVSNNAFQQQLKGDYESFITKFDSCGNLVWLTYFGTTGFDKGERIVYSPDSSIVITGSTDGVDLPVTNGCFQSVSNGFNDCYLAKFDLNGQAKWVSYFGGSQADFSYAIDIDKAMNIIIGGTSLSPTLYPTSQSFQPNLAGAVDAFIAKFTKNGQLLFSTFYGGTSAEDIHDVGTDGQNNIIGIGGSFSNNLSTTPNCLQPSSNGGMEIYVIKLDSAGNRIFSTYIGGNLLDDAYGLTIDAQNNIYLTGHTGSTDFYKTSVSYQTSIAGSTDNFCIKLNPNGGLIWSTIFGGLGLDRNVNSAMDDDNNIFALMNSQSTDYPMLGVGNFTVNNGFADVVIAKLNENGVLIWTSYKGGSGNENAGDLLLLKNKVVVCGATSSADFPVTAGNFQMTNSGQDDGFLSTFQTSVTIFVNTSVKENPMVDQYVKLMYQHHLVMATVKSDIKQLEVYDYFGNLIDKVKCEANITLLYNMFPEKVYFVIGKDDSGAIVYRGKLIIKS